MSQTVHADAEMAEVEASLLTLVAAVEELSLAATIEEVAAVIRSAARRMVGADGVSFVIRDGEECFYLDEDAIAPLWKGRRFTAAECISGWAMAHRQTVIVPDVDADLRIPHHLYRRTFVRSLVMTPVRPRDPIAAIGAYWARPYQPSHGEVAKLEVMARAAAAALESARLQATLLDALERRKLLLRELDHRCKNTLAAVQSIAVQTLRRSPSPPEFVEAFTGRLGALAGAHDMLTREYWGHCSLAEVAEATLQPFGGPASAQITISGPAVRLAPEVAVAMHMTLYELAVNAAKYGALSLEPGRVSLTWSVDHSPEPGRFQMSWIERGGPRASPPARRGFGSRLVEEGLSRELGGAAKLSFPPEGLCFRLLAPLSARLISG